jgi:hypothetical protein
MQLGTELPTPHRARAPRTETGERYASSTYSPGRRTAVVLSGTGAHGAYHAGVLKALQEAGVKIDLVAGHGIGAAGAALAAIDGGARLWDANGVWRSPAAARMYAWTAPLRACAWVGLALLVVLLIPVLVLALGIVVLPVGLLLEMTGADAGSALTSAYFGWLQASFASDRLPTIVPRLALVTLAALVLTLVVGVVVADRRAMPRRRAGGRWWWRALGAPLDAERERQRFAGVIWELIRGAAALARPSPTALSRRYAEVLAENLGQPGFRELLLVATDLDARRDVVAALLRDPFKQAFLAPRPGGDRRAEVLDLTGISRDHALDILSAALTPPLVCEPHLVTFAADGFWRGETHRLCDRPGAVVRLLEEVAAAGATQVIVVSAVTPVRAPHHLRAPRVDLRSRIGEFQAAAEAASLRDAIDVAPQQFEAVFIVCPAHNAIGPFDVAGAYDEASDRHQTLTELMERAYEDAYRQFIEPVVGASGEQLASAP